MKNKKIIIKINNKTYFFPAEDEEILRKWNLI
jgi:hypothetical protein